jgi:hypothetical protein
VEASKIRHHFQTGVWDEKVHAMRTVAAARLCEVARAGGDDDHSSVATGDDDPLEICHCGSQRDLMDNDNFTHNVEIAILQFVDGRELTARVSAAKTHIIETVYHDWSVSG